MIQRFIFLPLLITSVSCGCALWYYLEIELVFLPLRAVMTSNGMFVDTWELSLDIALVSLFIGLFLGMAISPLALVWNFIKNRGTLCSSDEMTARLLCNVAWFGLYALMFSVLNLCLYRSALPLILKFPPVEFDFWEEGFGCAHIVYAGLDSISYVLAVFYSLDMPEILIPLVLFKALKRTMRLEH